MERIKHTFTASSMVLCTRVTPLLAQSALINLQNIFSLNKIVWAMLEYKNPVKYEINFVLVAQVRTTSMRFDHNYFCSNEHFIWIKENLFICFISFIFFGLFMLLLLLLLLSCDRRRRRQSNEIQLILVYRSLRLNLVTLVPNIKRRYIYV